MVNYIIRNFNKFIDSYEIVKLKTHPECNQISHNILYSKDKLSKDKDASVSYTITLKIKPGYNLIGKTIFADNFVETICPLFTDNRNCEIYITNYMHYSSEVCDICKNNVQDKRCYTKISDFKYFPYVLLYNRYFYKDIVIINNDEKCEEIKIVCLYLHRKAREYIMDSSVVLSSYSCNLKI